LQFIRSYSNNISKDDEYYSKKEGGVDRLKPEIFNGIKIFKIFTNDHQYIFTEKDTSKIVESFNYFAVFNFDTQEKNKIWIIKYSEVKKIEISFSH
jgi:hypothetical protein